MSQPAKASPEPPAPVGVEIWGESHQGQLWPENQDTIFFPGQPGVWVTAEHVGKRGYLFAVSDGVGGAEGGGEASNLVIQGLVEAYYRAAGGATFNPSLHLRSAVEKANARAHQGRTHRQSGATLVAAVIWQNQLHVANVGDSRAYLVREGQVLAADH